MSIVRAVMAAIVAGALVFGGASASVSARDQRSVPDHGLTLGVVPQRDFDAVDTALMGAAGIDSIRAWFSWGQVESQRGRYDWSGPDAVVRTAAGDGLTVFPFLFTEPEWAIALDRHECGVRCFTYAPSSTATRDAYGEFAAAAARRYGPSGSFWADHRELPYLPIGWWQIWNEQNSKFFYRPVADPASYAALLRVAASRIRAVDGGAEIVLGGMWSAEDRPEGVIGSAHYLEQLYRVRGIAGSFDAIAVHPYASHIRDVFAQIEAIRQVAGRARDGSVGLWVTELGWASAGRPNNGLVKDPARQARLLERSFGRLLRRRAAYHLRGAYWYAWRDTERGGAVCSWCAYSGLVSRDGSLKPAYEAMRTLSLARE
jgi:polysaccharide biosynthesis protein PslG